ncbi:hypothetical protein [Deinococcus pimensis]|uniref:hypothetical protein n=1 Tax=Deinococcus pimensis TaxID=309888 RepID=UPI0012FC67E8|nr:hypothetical protein [Deinococcus pimensis]
MPHIKTFAPAVASALAFVLSSCSTSPAAQQGLDKQPGRFSLSRAEGLSGQALRDSSAASSSLTTQAATTINVGDIKNTSTYYFILANSGGTPITDIKLTSSNPAFAVSPGGIDSLGTTQDVGIIPIVKVTAVHGASSTGLGTAPLLPMGMNESVVHIEGVTKDGNNNAVPVVLDATVQGDAKLMNVSLTHQGQDVPLNTRQRVLPCADWIGATLYLRCDNTEVTFKNTGNVSLKVTQTSTSDGSPTPQGPFILQPGEAFTSTVKQWGEAACYSLDSGNVQRDQTQLPVLLDGTSQLCVLHFPGFR